MHIEGKGVEQGTLGVDAKYFTMQLMGKKWDRDSGEGGAG